MPFRRVLERCPEVTGYDALDIEERSAGVTFVASIENMAPVSDGRYGSVLCSEVLEHVASPWRALEEVRRVLEPGGVLVLTVPFLARLHEEPQDYYRYTEHGLRTLLTRVGFEVEDIALTGSLFSFLGHQVASVLVPGTVGIPGVEQFVFALNVAAVVFPCRLLDRMLPARRKFPLGYVVVARRS